MYFQALAERSLNQFIFSVGDFSATFQAHVGNKVALASLGFSQAAIDSALGPAALMQLNDDTLRRYAASLYEMSVSVSFILPSQLIAVNLASRLAPERDLIIRAGTGQGKSLVLALSAVAAFRDAPSPSRVFVLTTFDHLAVRDEAFASRLANAEGLTSIALTHDPASLSGFTLARIVYANAFAVEKLLGELIVEIYEGRTLGLDQATFVNTLFNIEDSSNYVLLDEFDLIFDDLRRHETGFFRLSQFLERAVRIVGVSGSMSDDAKVVFGSRKGGATVSHFVLPYSHDPELFDTRIVPDDFEAEAPIDWGSEADLKEGSGIWCHTRKVINNPDDHVVPNDPATGIPYTGDIIRASFAIPTLAEVEAWAQQIIGDIIGVTSQPGPKRPILIFAPSANKVFKIGPPAKAGEWPPVRGRGVGMGCTSCFIFTCHHHDASTHCSADQVDQGLPHHIGQGMFLSRRQLRPTDGPRPDRRRDAEDWPGRLHHNCRPQARPRHRRPTEPRHHRWPARHRRHRGSAQAPSQADDRPHGALRTTGLLLHNHPSPYRVRFIRGKRPLRGRQTVVDDGNAPPHRARCRAPLVVESSTVDCGPLELCPGVAGVSAIL